MGPSTFTKPSRRSSRATTTRTRRRGTRSPGARKLGYLEKLSNLTGPRASTTATCAAPAVPSAASAALSAASAAAERKLLAHLCKHTKEVRYGRPARPKRLIGGRCLSLGQPGASSGAGEACSAPFRWALFFYTGAHSSAVSWSLLVRARRSVCGQLASARTARAASFFAAQCSGVSPRCVRTFGSALCSSSSRIGSSALTDAAQCSACQPSASSATGSAPAPSSRATTSLDDSLCWQATCRHVDPRSRWPFGSAFSASSCAALRTSLALVKNKLLSLRPAGSPEASLSAGACRRQPGASASLGQSAAWSALAGLRALFHTVVRLGGFVQPLLFALRAAGKGVQHPFESCVGTGRRRARSATQLLALFWQNKVKNREIKIGVASKSRPRPNRPSLLPHFTAPPLATPTFACLRSYHTSQVHSGRPWRS